MLSSFTPGTRIKLLTSLLTVGGIGGIGGIGQGQGQGIGGLGSKAGSSSGMGMGGIGGGMGALGMGRVIKARDEGPGATAAPPTFHSIVPIAHDGTATNACLKCD